MAQQPPDGDLFLAGGSKLRPVLRHRRLDVQQTTLHELVRAQCCHAFGGGIHVDERVALPLTCSGEIVVSAP